MKEKNNINVKTIKQYENVILKNNLSCLERLFFILLSLQFIVVFAVN